MSTSAMTIGQLSQQVGLGVETIRFYERRGLIPDPPRRRSGYRQYPPETIPRLRFILRAKELGFSLREITELLSLRVESETTCHQIRRRTEDKLHDIEGRIESLRRIRQALMKLAAACSGKGPASECPILEALDAP